MPDRRVRFRGLDLILVGDDVRDGALAFEGDYRAGRASYAHACDDGFVRRFRRILGRAEDLEIGDLCEIEMEPGALLNVLTHPTWSGPVVEDGPC